MRSFNLEKTVKLKLMMFDNDINKVEVKTYELNFTLSTDATDIEDLFQAQVDQNVSFSKILYFLENVVDESFIFKKDIMDAMNKYVATTFENNLILMPSLEENILVLALHSKMNAIAIQSRIERIQLKDLDLQLSYDYYSDEFDDVAPALPSMDDWMGELSFWQEPWWNRPDASTYDNCAESPEELTAIKKKIEEGDESTENIHTQAFEVLEAEIRSLFKRARDAKEGKDAEEAEVIEIDFAEKKQKKWVPKIV